jgi:hydrogenase maturation protease
METVVLGLGNLLLADEGVGVHAAHALLREGLTNVVDVGTALLEALPALERADRVVVVDAVQAGGPPGSVYRVPLEKMQRKEVIASMHGFDLPRTLALAGRTEAPEVIVIGVEPATMSWSMELSPAVAAALPAVLAAVRTELAALQPSRPAEVHTGRP